MTVTRFAPSPTGRLHVGNLRAALHNWLLARHGARGSDGGDESRFLLRIDDTDTERSREDYVEAIREDLAWLGLEPDAEFRQSERLDLYEDAFARLKEAERVYPAYETAQELELKRKIALGRGLPPIYDRAALQLGEDERAAKEADGVSPHWRFKLDREEHIDWEDEVRGPQKFDPAQLSDPVIRRADGSWLYMLPSVVDDLDMGVTDVLRGEDHVSNTAVQIQMFSALHAAGVGPEHCSVVDSFPRFGHTALLVGKEGKLSKRLGSLSCEALREQGIEPEAILSLLARLGTSKPVEPIVDRGVLIESFDLASFGRAPAKFDEAELERLNAAIVHQLDYDAVKDRLPDGIDEAGWHAIRPNLSHVNEAAEWWRLVTGPIDPPDFSDEDRGFLADAAQALEWSDDPWAKLTSTLKERTGRKGKPLFLPLRQALTGRDHGPDMGELLPLIGEDEARARLERAAAPGG
ncbi:glutamate--tRNA ligase [Alteriqipengyuania lutimaris]|uniref:Glutamate--tRNA ligase n=1 Tax=Alteriqipengyuania lutimaris TaxID=1538146 RepID=A0A395LJJ3_9SPHN|nr:glutamate--tRNA ligase [Alteriqipengyuania lutimaris]MBB3034643.1 glutamyl-tRNA synthetase [Alteriqipengyuania lutimaris]RDS76487.1 glutamate--tRNA ligase [Alteriqipengyuania lutimaris]